MFLHGMRERIRSLWLSVIVCAVLCVPAVVMAKKTISDAIPQLNKTVAPTGVEQKEIPVIVGDFIKTALGMVGLVFFALMVYAGFLWLTARGEEDQISKAKSVLKAAMIGLGLIVMAYAITNFVTTRLIEGQQNPDGPSPVDEPVGCCYDWTKGPRSDIDITPAIKTWRMDTQTHCKYKGETSGVEGDFWAGPEGEGYWQFNAGWNEQRCEANFE